MKKSMNINESIPLTITHVKENRKTGEKRKFFVDTVIMLDIFISLYNETVVKELRSKMLGQHPGYFKAVFLKKTQIIIVNIYEYTVYIMF
jgi:hypothetical protein